jgi:hypothetical protein
VGEVLDSKRLLGEAWGTLWNGRKEVEICSLDRQHSYGNLYLWKVGEGDSEGGIVAAVFVWMAIAAEGLLISERL